MQAIFSREFESYVKTGRKGEKSEKHGRILANYNNPYSTTHDTGYNFQDVLKGIKGRKIGW